MGDGDRIVGKHVLASLYGVPRDIAGDEGFLVEVVKRAVEASGATLHSIHSWVIPGEKGGVSVIALVLESHVAIHTWLEYDYATVDVYTCGEHTDPWRAFEVIRRELRPEYYVVSYADRSQVPVRGRIHGLPQRGES